MQPQIALNWPAVLVAVVAGFAIGGIWYGPLFGKTWQRAMGYVGDKQPTGREIARGSIINLIGLAAMVFVLAHDVTIWRPSTWGLTGDKAAAVYGFFAGLFVWIGFVVPMLLNGVAYERKSWKVFGIGAGYQLVALQAMAMILAFWR